MKDVIITVKGTQGLDDNTDVVEITSLVIVLSYLVL